MPWYRTSGGRLIHGEGGLATVYKRNGWEQVPDEVALAEVTSGEAQVRADVEAEQGRIVDDAEVQVHPGTGVVSEGVEAPADGTLAELTVEGTPDEPDPAEQTVTDSRGTGLFTTRGRGRRGLGVEEQKLVDDAIRDEG